GRDRGAHEPDAGVRARREGARPARDVSRRRVHAAGEPRRNRRVDGAVRPHAGARRPTGAARRPAVARARFRRRATLYGRGRRGTVGRGVSHERPPPAAERERELDAVRASDAEALVALFDRAGCACFCRYWHFEGDKNAWLERLAFGREAGIAELTESLRRTELAPHGVVAREGAAIVGWMKLTRAERVEKLYAQRVYRGLPCFAGDRRDVFTIGCVLVDPEVRGTGVAHGL